MEVKERDYETCGFCTEYDGDNCYCMARGEFEKNEGDTCDGFNPEAELLTEEEKAEIEGDWKYP